MLCISTTVEGRPREGKRKEPSPACLPLSQAGVGLRRSEKNIYTLVLHNSCLNPLATRFVSPGSAQSKEQKSLEVVNHSPGGWRRYPRRGCGVHVTEAWECGQREGDGRDSHYNSPHKTSHCITRAVGSHGYSQMEGVYLSKNACLGGWWGPH